MSLVDHISGVQVEPLAVLFCDLSAAHAGAPVESDVALWRVDYFRAAREMAADYGGSEVTAPADGWAVTFNSTVDALMCARALSSLVGWQSGGASLSGGLSAGDVHQDPFGIDGTPVREAIGLCRQALPWQVLVADPLKVVVSRETARSFAAAPLPATADSCAATPRAPLAVIAPSRPRSISGPRPMDGAGHLGRHDGRLDVEPSLRLVTNASPTNAAAATAGPTTAAKPTATSSTASIAITSSACLTTTATTTAAVTTTTLTTGPTFATRAPTTAASTLAGLQLRVLGWVQVEAGEPPLQRSVLRGTQARAVLCMLALRRGPVHKEELAELLWPDELPDHWEGALRGLVTKIRRFMDAGGLPGKSALLGEGGYYELHLPSGATVDRDVAIASIAAAEAALDAGRPAEAESLARRAVTILERNLLCGQDNAWFDQVRAELAHDRLEALELCARADLAAGGTDAAKRAANEALALDPYRESSFRLLMQAHASGGSRGEALRTYERCRRMLAEELGVGPAAQTQALYIHLLG